MKKTLCLVLAVLMVMTLASCGLFTSGDDGEKDASGSKGDIKMTDKYTFKDPGDLEYAKRYVIHGDENSIMVSSAADYGMKAIYSVIYADTDDAPVGSYDFIIVDSAEHAQSMIDLYAAQGSVVTATEEDPCVLYAFTDGETYEATLIMMQSLGAISDTTVNAYVEWYAGSIGASVE